MTSREKEDTFPQGFQHHWPTTRDYHMFTVVHYESPLVNGPQHVSTQSHHPKPCRPRKTSK